MHGAMLKNVWDSAHARNHVICLRWPKCLIAVVLADVHLPYWTSKVEHILSFTAIFSNICIAHAQKRLFMNFRCKFRHRRSIRRHRFPVRVQNFGDLAFPLIFAFYMPKVRHIKGRLQSSVTNAKALDCVNFLRVTLWPWPSTFWPWTVAVHGESCDQPVRYAEFTPRPVNQAGAQGEEAGMRLANGGAQQRRRRGQNA